MIFRSLTTCVSIFLENNFLTPEIIQNGALALDHLILMFVSEISIDRYGLLIPEKKYDVLALSLTNTATFSRHLKPLEAEGPCAFPTVNFGKILPQLSITPVVVQQNSVVRRIINSFKYKQCFLYFYVCNKFIYT